MDCNSYSYTPYMLDESPVKEYHNDDMYVEINKTRAYSRVYYEIFACSYDGSFEVAERFDCLEMVTKLFDFIVDNYATTPPAEGNIEKYIDDLKNGFIFIESLPY